MITVNQAVSIIKSSVVQLKTEYINVENAINRILATDIKSKANSPPFDMSSMDGYAVKINKNFNQTKFKVIHEIFAGDNKNLKVLEGQTIRVFTGSKMPLGATRVIIQEKKHDHAGALLLACTMFIFKNIIKKEIIMLLININIGFFE